MRRITVIGQIQQPFDRGNHKVRILRCLPCIFSTVLVLQIERRCPSLRQP